MRKRITLFAIITIVLFICIPAFAQHFFGAFSGAELQVDTQIETPAQNNNAKTLSEQQAGNTIRFQLFVPAGGGRATNGYALELDLRGKTFSSYIGTVSGKDWTGAALVSTGTKELSALFITGATVPSTGYLGQIELQVTQPLEDGATLIVKSMSLTSGRDVDQLDVSNAMISFTAPSASTCPGDFDGNGRVDIADFLSFVDVYGSSSSDVTYNVQMDFDSSGRVDIADFLSFVDVYDTTCESQPSPGGGSGGGGGNSSGSPDLIVDSPSVSDSTLTAGQSFTLHATVRNQGNGEAAATTLRYYRSSNETISASDTQVGTDSVSGLSASATSDESISVTAPSSAGTYYYGACAGRVSGESNTDNNCSKGVRVTVSSSSGGGGETPPSSTPVPFALHEGNNAPSGIVYANNRFYVPDYADEKVYAYTSSGQRDTSAEFDLDSENGFPRGITYANNRFYVIQFYPKKVFVYTSSGQRVESADFDLDIDNYAPEGITYANNRFYVVDEEARKIFVYTSNGQRVESADFDIAEDNIYPVTITYANNRFYVIGVIDDGSLARRVLVYTSNGQRVESADFDLVNIEFVYAAGITYAHNQFYVVNDVTDLTRKGKVHAYTSSGQRVESADFDLEDTSESPGGIVYANNRFYVVDKHDNKVYVYTSSGQRDASAEFDLDTANKNSQGITYANNRFYVIGSVGSVGSFDRKVYAYTSSGQRDASAEFDLDTGEGEHPNPLGITYTNNRFYVVNVGYTLVGTSRATKVYAYTSSGQRDASADFNLDAIYARGIVYANNRFYVVDDRSEKVYVYTSSGQRDASAEFDLDSENGLPIGITYTNNRFYVVDADDDSVYMYTGAGQ